MATLLKVLNNLADSKSAGGCTSRQNSGIQIDKTSKTFPLDQLCLMEYAMFALKLEEWIVA